MLRTLSLFIVALVLATSAPASALAQQAGPPATPRRAALERQLRMRTGEMVRRRLQLTDDQMTRLQATNRQFEQERGTLIVRERELRRALRDEIMAGERANQERVSQLLDQTFVIERKRFDLVESEQKALAQFLTPVQRAKLLGLQGELRQRTQQLRRGVDR